jgi:DNA-binding LytR/AlgR family response regulator
MVNKRRVILVDDEPLARLGLKNILTSRHPDFEVVGEAETAAEAFELMDQDGQIDGVFLDIHIQTESERSGLDFGFALNHRSNPPWIVFITGYEKHALESHEIHALGYLLKPLEIAKVDNTLDWIRKNRPLCRAKRMQIRHRIINHLGEKQWHNEFIEPDEMLYIHKNNYENTVRVHLSQGGILDGVGGILKDWESKLVHYGFLKISRSCIVNLKNVRGLKAPQIGGEVYKLYFKYGADELSVSTDHLEKLLAAIKL